MTGTMSVLNVADRVVPQRMHSVKKEFVMEGTVPMLSEQDRHVQRINLRQYVREVGTLRMIAADKAGLASGQVIDMSIRGCGLRITKPLTRAVPDTQGVSERRDHVRTM